MAITYPLLLPTSIGIAQIELRAVNVVSASQSPFTFKQQVIKHQGQRWEASVTIPPVHRDLAADWKAFLIALNGMQGTFLLGDPDYATPRGDVSSCVGIGTAGESTLNVTMTGSLKAGDYINLGGYGTGSKLYMVLQDQDGSGTLQIWPNLRVSTSPTGDTVYFNNAVGVFRLTSNTNGWGINENSSYSLSFDCQEVV